MKTHFIKHVDDLLCVFNICGLVMEFITGILQLDTQNFDLRRNNWYLNKLFKRHITNLLLQSFGILSLVLELFHDHLLI